jgi:polyisoprenoid-binding protein YceI
MRAALAFLALALAATPAAAAHWTVDAAKSKLGFQVKWSDAPYAAAFKTWKADIDFDPADLAHARAAVTIDLGSLASDAPDNDEGVRGTQGFNVSHFPAARFETTGFKAAGPGQYVADGNLTLHGITRHVTLPFTLKIEGDKATMNGKTEVLRTDFGLGQGEWAGETPIAHQVTIAVHIEAAKGK